MTEPEPITHLGRTAAQLAAAAATALRLLSQLAAEAKVLSDVGEVSTVLAGLAASVEPLPHVLARLDALLDHERSAPEAGSTADLYFGGAAADAERLHEALTAARQALDAAQYQG